MSQNQMFCYQCEQTAAGKGCTVAGVCGKTPDVAALQDLLLYALKGLSRVVLEAKKAGIRDEKISVFTCEALFSTMTNVNFDADVTIEKIKKSVELRKSLQQKVESTKSCDWYALDCEPVNLVL